MGNTLTVDDLNATLDDRWEHGTVTGMTAERIGSEYGFSGTVHRLLVETDTGRHRLIAKTEDAERTRRARDFRSRYEDRLAGLIPRSYGSRVEAARDRGLLLMEDLAECRQGDVLVGVGATQARALVHVLGKIHAVTWLGHASPRSDVADWRGTALADVWADAHWGRALERARSRYPGDFTAGVVDRLHRLHTELPAAIGTLREGPVVFAHMDPHLDNTMWRTDGTPLLLDWSNATVAPPTYDLAQLVIALALEHNSPLEPGTVVDAYRAGLGPHEGVETSIRAAMRLFLRGVVGFLGKEDDSAVHPRLLLLRDRAAANLSPILSWLDGD
ncbi:MAG: aminoglycoside phosphotransferase family protein [Deltaproteobacteria bacterium]